MGEKIAPCTLHTLTNQDSDEDSSYAGYCDDDEELGGRVKGDTITTDTITADTIIDDTITADTITTDTITADTITADLQLLNLPHFQDWASTRILTS